MALLVRQSWKSCAINNKHKSAGSVFHIKPWLLSGSRFHHVTEYSWSILGVLQIYISSIMTLDTSVSARTFLSSCPTLAGLRQIGGCCSARPPFLLQGVEFRKCACLLAVWCDAMWQAETSLGATCPSAHATGSSPSPSPLAHRWAKISLCRLSDARPRTQPLTKGGHWLIVDASPKSAWFWATETKGWG